MRKKNQHRTRPNRLRELFARNKKVDTIPTEQERQPEAKRTEHLAAPLNQSNAEAQDGGGAGRRRQYPEKNADEDFKRTQIRQNWLLIGATVVIAVATVVYMVISALQLREIRQSASDTQKMIQATQRLANTSENTATQFGTIAESTGKQANASEISANASQTQADASVAQAAIAKQSLGAAQSAAKAAEKSGDVAVQGSRPYLDISARMTGNYADQQAAIEVLFVNEGNSPANVMIRYGIIITGRVRHESGGEIRPFTILPRKSEVIKIPVSNTPLAQLNEMIRAGHLTLKLMGIYDGVGGASPIDFCKTYPAARGNMDVYSISSPCAVTERE